MIAGTAFLLAMTLIFGALFVYDKEDPADY